MMKAKLKFEPRDLWIGVYWDRSPVRLDVYICVVPCFPLHIRIYRESKGG